MIHKIEALTILICMIWLVWWCFASIEKSRQKGLAIINEFRPKIQKATTIKELNTIHENLSLKALSKDGNFIEVGLPLEIKKLFASINDKLDLLESLNK